MLLIFGMEVKGFILKVSVTTIQLANATFSLPCEIAGNTSTPWTFIFPEMNETNANPQYTIWS